MEKKKFLFDSLSGLIGDIADGFVAKSENPEKDAEWRGWTGRNPDAGSLRAGLFR
jgi:hypothetical protein